MQYFLSEQFNKKRAKLKKEKRYIQFKALYRNKMVTMFQQS